MKTVGEAKNFLGVRQSVFRWLACLTLAFVGFSARAQLEPCGLFEFDGQPGYGLADLLYTASFWNETGDPPAVPDFDGDQTVSIRDLVRQLNCVGGLNHGLVGNYYGFQDETGQNISFPDFGAVPDPVIVRPTEFLEVLDGFRDFGDSGMRRQFGAVFEGYLFVPETANYTLHIFGTKGMRLFLDGAQILSFDTHPSEDTTIQALTYGLHPLRVEFYNAESNGRILFDWSSNGTVIGPQSQTVATGYLYHDSVVVPQYAGTDIEFLIDPPSGSRTGELSPQVEIFVLGPQTNLSFFINDEEKVLADGRFLETMNLSPGLNRIRLRATDGDGRVKESVYSIYSDQEPLPSNGLAVNLYATEWYDYPFPDTAQLTAYDKTVHPTTHLVPNNGLTIVGARPARGGVIVQLQGAIRIDTAGTYTFRIDDDGALYLNGELLCGIGVGYANQWRPEAEIYLEPGNHHWRVEASGPWSGPDIGVLWRFNGGTETFVPNTVLRNGPNHFAVVPSLPGLATGFRSGNGLMAEYLFKPGQTFEDSSGSGFHLWPERRAIQRSTGGVTFRTPGSMVTEQGGVRMVSEIIKSNGFSLEADFTFDEPVDDFVSREVISLTDSTWGRLARIYIVNNDVRFRVYGDNGEDYTVTANNFVTEGGRIHVVGSYDGGVIRLHVNGSVFELPQVVSIATWPTLAHLNVGQGFNRREAMSLQERQFYGTFLAAACYSRALTQPEINTNRAQNLIINPTPPPLTPPAPTAFPLIGTTQAELDEAHHILNRLSFGPSPESINEILAQGVGPWISQQLDPGSIDDSELDAFLSSGQFKPRHYDGDLRAQLLVRMTRSERQLLEVMTQFWENHFNTQIDKVDETALEYEENNRFRGLAFGSFGDLLRASALHWPMTVYLDSSSNIVGAQNENYAREILELHTHGVNNGYSQQDIVEAARCFTGWTVRDGKFYFDPGRHDYGEKTLLGITIPAGGGFSDGMRLIDHIVARPQTADFISWKLCQVFIDDDPPADVVNAASATFQATNGDIEQTLTVILNHARFRTDLAYRNNKVKTPLEFATSMIRMVEGEPIPFAMDTFLQEMGMTLFNYPEPTGFAEEGVSWIDTNSMLVRWNLTNALTTNRGNAIVFSMDIKGFVEKYGATSSDQILDLFENVTVHGAEPAGVRAIMESWLTDDNPGRVCPDRFDS